MHIGDITTRLISVSPRSENGVNIGGAEPGAGEDGICDMSGNSDLDTGTLVAAPLSRGPRRQVNLLNEERNAQAGSTKMSEIKKFEINNKK